MKKAYLFASALAVTSILVCGGVGIAKAAMAGTAESEETLIAKPTPIVREVNAESDKEADEAYAKESLSLKDSNEEMDYYITYVRNNVSIE